MRFVGSGADCPPKVFSDVAALSAAGSSALSLATKRLLGWLSRETDADLSEVVKEIAESPGADVVSVGAWREGAGALLFVFQGCVRENLTPDAVADDLEQLGLPSDCAQAMGAVWKEKVIKTNLSCAERKIAPNGFPAVSYFPRAQSCWPFSLVARFHFPPHRLSARVTFISWLCSGQFAALARSATVNTLMVNELVDLQWKSGVTVSSSDCAKVGTAFLQMKLTLDRGNGATEDVQLELSLPQFYELLSEMQRAKANVEFFG
jgi:hypothetical protein